ncbi:MAG: glycosyl hydrolase 115 family protein [Ruminococcus sp.]|nr:glycosyl hydrolase 115 family protein [Ruminococcus sp.]
MNSTIRTDRSAPLHFVCDPGCRRGLIRTADSVRRDISLVLGVMPPEVGHTLPCPGAAVIFGTAGESILLDSLEAEGQIFLDGVRGKREVYGFFVLPENGYIVIAGSDRRGTVYGLYHLSELIGVSPLVNWSDVLPERRDEVSFSGADSMVSKEPSVRYRGFFINDEWPAFGSWAKKHFGGINAKLYEGVFELLLRLKGNYLWPAMWSSCFALDGPGLASAELADELGVIMGLSHHEPCLRHGEEFSTVRGKDSVYGDAWSFITNREGITRFWRDGLKRNGHLENIITVGMRGERDSTILGEDAGLKENIDLLRDVLKTQNALIREEVNSDLDSVPRMLALYKEVEPYYYGDAETPGLRDDPELDNVILMLCDDNHGYLRSLPDEAMRQHRGGFGMYYHFDYHGGPVSYEWICSTHLPEVQEQMTTCYEHGVSELWIVNVGDLGLQELPLCYFLELAYDVDKWGAGSGNSTDDYVREWLGRQFGRALSADDISRLTDTYMRSMRLIHRRRPEHLNRGAYSPAEALGMLGEVSESAESIREFESKLPAELEGAFFETVGYNTLAGLGLIELWLCRILNRYFASVGAVCANSYGERMKVCFERDIQLRDRLHTLNGGKWDGFGLAEHIGFRFWNSEERRNPVIETVLPVGRPEVCVGVLGGEFTCGGEWTGKRLIVQAECCPDGRRRAYLYAAQSGTGRAEYTLTCGEGLKAEINAVPGVEGLDTIVLTADGDLRGTADAAVKRPGGTVKISVELDGEEITLPAERYSRLYDGEGCRFGVIRDLGNRDSALRVFPLNARPGTAEKAPAAEYEFECRGGEYLLSFVLMPCSPYRFGEGIRFVYELNGERREADVLPEGYEAGVSPRWGAGVLSHERFFTEAVSLGAGRNVLRIFGTGPEIVPERMILCRRK